MAENKGDKEMNIVRLADRDIRGDYNIERALREIKGISFSLAHAIVIVLEKKYNIDKNTQIGSLNEEKINLLDTIIRNPIEYGIPAFLVNRRKDRETGKDMHLISNDVDFYKRQDINFMISTGTWKGFRHQYGQKVRGQRTRSTGRTGPAVGVTKAKEEAKPQQQQQAKGKEEKK